MHKMATAQAALFGLRVHGLAKQSTTRYISGPISAGDGGYQHDPESPRGSRETINRDHTARPHPQFHIIANNITLDLVNVTTC